MKLGGFHKYTKGFRDLFCVMEIFDDLVRNSESLTNRHMLTLCSFRYKGCAKYITNNYFRSWYLIVLGLLPRPSPQQINEFLNLI